MITNKRNIHSLHTKYVKAGLEHKKINPNDLDVNQKFNK